MNPNLCRIVLRPRGPLEVFDLAWRFLRETWRVQLGLLAAVWLPPTLAAFPACWLLDGSPWLLLAPFLLGPLLQAPFTLATGRLLFDPDVRVWAVLRETAGRTLDLIPAWIVAGACWVVGVGSCGYGLVFAQAAVLYVPEAVLLERVGIRRAVRRSFRLAGAHVGLAGFGALARAILIVWCGLVGEYVGQGVFTWVLQLGEPFGTLTNGQVTPFLLGGLLASHPLHAVYRLLLYVDARTRNEGWDLQVGLRAAGLSS